MKKIEKLTEKSILDLELCHYLIPLNRLGLSARLMRAFQKVTFYSHQPTNYIGDLGMLPSRKFLADYQGVGCAVLQELEALMSRFGITFSSVSDIVLCKEDSSYPTIPQWRPDEIENLSLKYFPQLISIEEALEIIQKKESFSYEPFKHLFLPIAFIPWKKRRKDYLSEKGKVYVGDLGVGPLICSTGRLKSISPPDLYSDWRPLNVAEISKNYFPDKETALRFMAENGVKCNNTWCY